MNGVFRIYSLTSIQLWPLPNAIGFLQVYIHIPSIPSVTTSVPETSCLQGFHIWTSSCIRWPFDLHQNYRFRILNVVHLCANVRFVKAVFLITGTVWQTRTCMQTCRCIYTKIYPGTYLCWRSLSCASCVVCFISS